MKIPYEDSQLEKQDKHYIRLLELDKDFEELIILARNELGITKKLLNYYPDASTYSIAQDLAKNIVITYELPSIWINSISDFIVMGRLTSPYSGIFLRGLTYTYPEKRVLDLQIVAMQKMSWSAFLSWIKNNRRSIEDHLHELPQKNEEPKTSSKIFELKIKAFKLKRYGLSPKQIAQQLAKECEGDQKLYERITNNEISRWLNNVKDVVHRTKQLKKRFNRKPLQ